MKDLNVKSVNRRTVLLAAAGAAPLLAMGARAAMAAGLPQSAVSYQASPKDGKQCDGCNLFVAPASCKSVAGTIAPTGWCKLWVKKA
ncbi:MAG: high potential iron sulfur protein [Roseiarcus sp.]